MAVADLTEGQSQTPESSYKTAPITPGANRIALAFVMNIHVGGQAAQPIVSGNGLSWNVVQTVLINTPFSHRLTCFFATSTTANAGELTFDFVNQQQSACAWSVFEYDGVDTSGPIQSKALNLISPLSLRLDHPLSDANTSIVIAGIVIARAAGDAPTIQPGTGLTQMHERDVGSGVTGGSLQTEYRVGSDAPIEWTTGSPGFAAAIALELKSAGIVNVTKQLDPVMFFHPDEKFFPSDAQAYLEKCALWRAEAPFDQKDSWGGMGLPFDREPMIAYGAIASKDGSPGTYLGASGNLVNNSNEERFFDLAGWKDATGMPEAKVTAISKNSFSNRSAVAARYDTDPVLNASRFWYHAEFFPNARLQTLLVGGVPDLVKVLNSPDLLNPALICYYFFFPAHEEALPATCTNFEAGEFASFAGEWACMAILIEKDGSGQPSFIGQTGRLLLPVAGVNLPPQAEDSDDDARRIVMKITPFSGATLIEGHPVVFLAKGTHSCYLKSGIVEVTYPDATAPFQCGRADVPGPPGPPTSSSHGFGLFVAKLLMAAELGQPLGLGGAISWIIQEGDSLGSGLTIQGVDSPVAAAPDETAQPGNNKFLRPVGVAAQTVQANGGGTDLGNWQSSIVDRASQIWWPGDAPDVGYRGRWGARVANDPFGRRAGMRFPAFSKMFFLALAKGKADGTL
jgi:hypothetical protein